MHFTLLLCLYYRSGIKTQLVWQSSQNVIFVTGSPRCDALFFPTELINKQFICCYRFLLIVTKDSGKHTHCSSRIDTKRMATGWTTNVIVPFLLILHKVVPLLTRPPFYQCKWNLACKLPVMSSGHQARGNSALSLSNSTVPQEIITVHDCELIQKELYGAFVPSLLWTFALGRQGNISQIAPLPI